MKWLAFVVTILLLPPQSGVRVDLYLYRQEGAVWVEQAAGHCWTDEGGVCRIEGEGAAWADGLLRGELRWGEARRALIWPGGEIIVQAEGEAAGESRYDHLSAEAQAPRIEAERQGPLWALLLLAALTLGFSVAAGVKERKDRKERRPVF